MPWRLQPLAGAGFIFLINARICCIRKKEMKNKFQEKKKAEKKNMYFWQ